MNFTTGNPIEIPICVRCNTSRSLEQFSKSQRKRWKQKKTATCKKCQNAAATSGNRKHEETNLNVKASKKGSMCICIPQPFASFLVNGFYRFLPIRTITMLKNYRGTLFIASSEKHSRTDARVEFATLIKYYADQGIPIPQSHLKMPSNMPLSCLLGCVDVEELLPVEDVPDKYLSGYAKSLRFVLKINHQKRLLLPLSIDLSSAKSNVITLQKALIESAKLQDPRSPKFSLPPISMVEIVQYKEERKRKQLAKQKISKKKGIHDLHEEKFQDNKNSSSISDGSINDVVIVWFRQDFRIFDNPALYEAAKTGKKLVCVYIHPSTEEEAGWPLGGAAKLWLHDTLHDLSILLLKKFRLRLLVANAADFDNGTAGALCSVASQLNAKYVYFNRVYEPWKCKNDTLIKLELLKLKVATRSYKGIVLYEPWDARCDEKDAAMRLGFGSVGFFLRACQNIDIDMTPLPIPRKVHAYVGDLNFIEHQGYFSQHIDSLGLYVRPRRHNSDKDSHYKRKSCRYCHVKYGVSLADEKCQHFRNGEIDWGHDIRQFWDISEAGAHRALEYFLEHGIHEFDTREKHRADRKGTSMISPYMRFGQISPRQVLYEIQVKFNSKTISKSYVRKFAWRDLSYWFLWRFPNVCDVSFRLHYEQQSWTANKSQLQKWQRGHTGYPLVDAAMRQLWCTGWQPNYLRHVVAGFLIEYMNMDWKHGFKWFHDTLVDADVAIQAFMWQNGGGCGTDSWNFVMHPVNAAKAVDPEGDYVRRWVPELRGLPSGLIHAPWESDLGTLCSANVRLGGTYCRRFLCDLVRAHRKNFNAVMKIRNGIGKKYVLPSGHEAIPLDNGRTAVCITRVDYREGEIKTYQTAEEKWDKKRRLKTGDFVSGVLREVVDQYDRMYSS